MPENQNPGGEGQTPSQNQGGEQGGAPAAPVAPAAPEAPAWRAGLHDTIRGEKTWEKFRGNSWDEVGPQIASSYLNLEKHQGGMIRIPGENAKPEELAAFHAKLGVPDSHEKYPEVAVPEGMPWDKAGEAEFKKGAREVGMTPKQVDYVFKHYTTRLGTELQQVQKAQREAIEKGWGELQQKWGNATERNVAIVQRTLQENFSPDFVEWVNSSGAGNDPRFMAGMLRMGNTQLEHGFIKGDHLMKSANDAMAEIRAMEADQKGPLYNSADPTHKDALKKRDELYRIAYPEVR